jgi:hypothetical protein
MTVLATDPIIADDTTCSSTHIRTRLTTDATAPDDAATTVETDALVTVDDQRSRR